MIPEMKDCLSNCEDMAPGGVVGGRYCWSKLISYSLTANLDLSFVLGGWFASNPVGCSPSIWDHGGESACSEGGEA